MHGLKSFVHHFENMRKKCTTKPLWYQDGKNSEECGLHDASRAPSKFLKRTEMKYLNIKQGRLTDIKF